MEYLPKDDLKLTGRLEHRNEIDGDKSSYLAEVAAAYKLNPDYSLLLRERYFLEKNSADENHTSRFLVGLAYRPLDNDRFNALSKIEYKYNRQSASQPGDTANAFIFSTEGVFQANRNLQLTGKYAGKLEQDDCFTSYTDLITARLLYDLSDRFDIGAEYRLLTSHLTDTRLHGGSVEVGYRIMDQLWLSLGYSFNRFDADLAGDSYEGEGPYLKLRFKFDEKTLQPIRK
jgi:large repetitive protein